LRIKALKRLTISASLGGGQSGYRFRLQRSRGEDRANDSLQPMRRNADIGQNDFGFPQRHVSDDPEVRVRERNLEDS
jgi:hypothetical protein